MLHHVGHLHSIGQGTLKTKVVVVVGSNFSLKHVKFQNCLCGICCFAFFGGWKNTSDQKQEANASFFSEELQGRLGTAIAMIYRWVFDARTSGRF